MRQFPHRWPARCIILDAHYGRAIPDLTKTSARTGVVVDYRRVHHVLCLDFSVQSEEPR